VFITRHTPLFLFQTDETAGAAEQAPDMQGTPDIAAGEAAQQQPEIPAGYVPEDRYKEAQAWGTRTSQEAAELRRQNDLMQTLLYADDQDTRRQAAQELGIELDDEPDPNEGQQYLTREEWQTFQNAQRQQEQQRQEEQGVQHGSDRCEPRQRAQAGMDQQSHGEAVLQQEPAPRLDAAGPADDHRLAGAGADPQGSAPAPRRPRTPPAAC
jgi:hypothetical protein